MERLQKLMSEAGIASRRTAEGYLIAGRVMVNGQVAKLGDKADLAVDDVRVDGEPLRLPTTHTYVMVNKPLDVVTALERQAQEKRRLVRELVPLPGRLFPVGRLDADSEGLVLLTDDGDLAEKLTHPRYEHPKTYEVTVRGELTSEQLAMWERGVVLDDGPTLPAEVKVIGRDPGLTHLKIVMREGRKRQIRRVASLLGHPVSKLVRTQIGTLTLGRLQPGEWRPLSNQEIATLREQAGRPARRGRRRVNVHSPGRATSTNADSTPRTRVSHSAPRRSTSTGRQSDGSQSAAQKSRSRSGKS